MSDNEQAQAATPSELDEAITEAMRHPHVPTCVSKALALLAAELAELRNLLGA